MNFRVQLEGTSTHYWRHWQAKRDFRVKFNSLAGLTRRFKFSANFPMGRCSLHEGIPSTHRTFKKFNQNLFVFSNETEPDLSAADMERDNSNATHHKRIFDITSAGLSFPDSKHSCPVIYALVRNILTLPHITGDDPNFG